VDYFINKNARAFLQDAPLQGFDPGGGGGFDGIKFARHTAGAVRSFLSGDMAAGLGQFGYDR